MALQLQFENDLGGYSGQCEGGIISKNWVRVVNEVNGVRLEATFLGQPVKGEIDQNFYSNWLENKEALNTTYLGRRIEDGPGSSLRGV